MLVETVCRGRELGAGPHRLLPLLRPLPLPLSLPLLPLPPLPPLPLAALPCSSAHNNCNYCLLRLPFSPHTYYIFSLLLLVLVFYSSVMSGYFYIPSLELDPLLLSDSSSDSCGKGNSGSSSMSGSSPESISCSPYPSSISRVSSTVNLANLTMIALL